MADSWKIDGDCNACRRKNYYSKQCRKRSQWGRSMIEKAMAEFIMSKFTRTTNGPHPDMGQGKDGVGE